MSKTSAHRSHLPVTALTVVASLFNLFLPILLVRLFDPHDIGVYKLFFLYASVVPAFSFVPGLISGIAYWSGRGAEGRTAVSTSGWSMLFIASFVCAVGVVAAPFLSELTGWTETVTLLFVVYSASYLASGFFEEAAISAGRSWFGAGFFSSFELIKMLVVLGAAVEFETLDAVLVAYTAVSVLKLLLGYLGSVWLGLVTWDFSFAQLRAVARYSLPVGVAWMFGVFIEKSDQLVLSALIPPPEFALYALGCLAVPPLFAFEQSVARVLIPQLSSAFHQKNYRGAAFLYSQAVEQLAVVLVPAAVGMCVFAEPIVTILFGSSYRYAALYMQVFSLSYLALIVPGDSVARATGSSGWILKSFMGFSFVSLALSGVGAWLMGAMGALIGFLVSRFFMRLVCLKKSLEWGNWKISYTLPWRNLGLIFALAIGLGAAMLLLKPLFSSLVLWFLVGGPIFTFIYFGTVFFLIRFPLVELESSSKVAMLVMNLQLGGLERMTVTLSKELKSTGRWSPMIVCYEPGDIPADPGLMEDVTAADIDVINIPKPPGFSLKAGWKIAKVLKSKQVEVLHAHNLSAAMYGIIVKVLFGGRLRIVYTQHTLVHVQACGRYRWYEWIVGRLVDQVVVMSPEIRSFYQHIGLSEPKVRFIANGVSVNSECPRDKNELRALLSEKYPNLRPFYERIWVLALARIDQIKGQTSLAGVWTKLPHDVQDRCILVFVGPETTPGELDRLRDAAGELLDRSVIVTGEGGDPWIWMHASDMYISASQFEGMPLAPLEALAAGLPLLLSDICGHHFLSDVAQLFPIQEVGRTTEIIANAIADYTVLNKAEIRERNIEWVSGRYGLANSCRAYEQVYRGKSGVGIE